LLGPPLVVVLVLVLVDSPLEQVQMQMQLPSWSLVLPRQVSVVYLGKPRPLV
jgi:hypothetical protein